jgi:VanZ family protein
MAFAISVATIVILSLLPARSLPSIGVSDKLGHFVAYALLGLIAGFAYPTQRARILLMAFLSTLGIGLELCQWVVPGRSPEIFDAIASGFGTFTTLGLHLLLRSEFRRHECK